jgi:hypothetical protein
MTFDLARALLARRIIIRYRQASPRSFCARREARPDLYADLQKQFKQFQSSLFALSPVADEFSDRNVKDGALDLIDDLAVRLDEAIGLPHEQVLEEKYEAPIGAIKVGLKGLEDLLTQGIPGMPPKKQSKATSLVKSKLKAALGALDGIERFLVKYAKEMRDQEAKDRQKAEKERAKADAEAAKAEKARQKAEKAEAKAKDNKDWCADNCKPCQDPEDFFMGSF